MTAALHYAALCCVAAGLLAAALVLVRIGNVRLALRIALDLWLAAGLLRLAMAPAWESLLAAALIVTIRRLVGSALRSRPMATATARAAARPSD